MDKIQEILDELSIHEIAARDHQEELAVEALETSMDIDYGAVLL